ncbi:HD-GYP domain-containing protein [Texcoconibacillus texcoconensis]|uniref:HD-GYP domain-containing protein (C-di-GMP phosphodiesterase class II) n=1 Tax=Texcoconibacillus texcoconensis TaxID=1095777 RepID=A0A840QLK4_9BACI|nr:HD domain-containing phosphohydrolase [Texcoconibacillus texcoconensis]MBB5172255.1 HD-GYP domain-containing protein (c-di-GMP phosphodiesterase class II) [Texcoconibacillus texcoconensis]
MRYTSIDHVQHGERLAKHIYAQDGRVLLNEGVTITVSLIAKLRNMGVTAIFIQDERFADVEIENVVSEKTKQEMLSTLAESVKFVQEEKSLNEKAVSSVAKKLIEEVLQNQEHLVHLSDIRTEDNQLFVHCVNVCILSVLIGVQVGLSHEKLHQLAIGALFHDIGKVVSSQQIKQPSGYNQNIADEGYDHHAWHGFQFLRRLNGISTLSAHIALTHHEHIDGSGQPRGLIGTDIHYLAKIVAVTNSYDRLVTKTGDEQSLLPYDASEKIMGLANIHYDYQVVWRFLRSIALYPTGSQVKLTSGEYGVVVSQHRGLPQRPIVRTFTENHKDITFEEIDLAKHPTIFIERMIV